MNAVAALAAAGYLRRVAKRSARRKTAQKRTRKPKAGACMTLAAIGRRFGLTKESVRRIEAAALAKLRRAIEREARARGLTVAEWLF